MLTSVLANFLPLTIAFNFYLLIQSNANNAASDAGGGVGLTPTTVGIPVLGYVIGAAIFFAGAYFIYRRLVLKKKDVLSK
jgi:nitrate reductase gamma subunit